MSRRIHLIAVAVLLAAVVPVSAASDGLELVPEDAALSVVVRNIGDFRKKANKYPEYLDPIGGTGICDFCELLTLRLDIRDNFDEDAPLALVVANPKGAGRKAVAEGEATGLDLAAIAIPLSTACPTEDHPEPARATATASAIPSGRCLD